MINVSEQMLTFFQFIYLSEQLISLLAVDVKKNLSVFKICSQLLCFCLCFAEGRPNTYTFTKALAENVVAENKVHVPTIIVRPSIGKI